MQKANSSGEKQNRKTETEVGGKVDEQKRAANRTHNATCRWSFIMRLRWHNTAYG